MTTNRVRPRRPTKRRRDAPQEGPDWWEMANTLLHIRAEGRCEHCGEYPRPTDQWERHHRMRRRDGGDRLSNLLMVHRRCHTYITEHPEEAYANGWSVRALGGQDPALVPVRYRGDKWWTLDDYGARRFIP